AVRGFQLFHWMFLPREREREYRGRCAAGHPQIYRCAEFPNRWVIVKCIPPSASARSLSPHPGPLPVGEGDSSASLSSNRAPVSVEDRTTMLPLPQAHRGGPGG